MAKSIALTCLRTLTLERPSRSGRLAHVSAASGLVRAGDRLYVVADDEHHLGVFPATGDLPGSLVRISDGTLPLDTDERKRRKRDFESLARLPAFAGHPQGALLALGSCSKGRRRRGVLARLDAQGRLDGAMTGIDLAPLSEALESRFGKPNIEGALVLGEELVLLQRGNKGDRRNARIRLRLDRAMQSMAANGAIGTESLVRIEEVDLGLVGGVPLCFSDGCALPDGRMVFTAIAEDTGDSYRDGACCGAALGILGRGGELELMAPIDPRYKVEGIEVTVGADGLDVLLVTDADDPDVPASLLAGRIQA